MTQFVVSEKAQVQQSEANGAAKMSGSGSITANTEMIPVLVNFLITSGLATIDSERDSKPDSSIQVWTTLFHTTPMNPHFLWLTEGLELLTFIFIAPALAIVIAYRTWREKEQKSDPKRYGARCVGFAVAGLSLFAFAKWIDFDVRSPKYFLYLAGVLLSFLSFGICQGYFFSALLDLWRWHKTTRL